MYQIQLPLQTLPINITCGSDGRVGFSLKGAFPTLVDAYDEANGKVAIFDMTGFNIDGVECKYNVWYDYKQMPSMLEYLKQLNMEMPVFQ